MASSYDPRQKSVMAEVREAAERIMVVARNAEMIEGRGGHHYEMLVEDIRQTQAKILGILAELREHWGRLEDQGQQLRAVGALQARNVGSALLDITQTLQTIMDRIEGRGGRPWDGQRRQIT